MKKIVFALVFLTTVLHSQKKKIFNKKNAPYTLQCKRIGDLIIKKEPSLNISEWCENLALGKAEQYILHLQSEIKTVNDDITYDIILLKEEAPIFYTINIYNKKTLEEFGQLFIAFKDRENNLVDNINYLSKTDLDKIESDNKSLENVKLPPPPISKN